MFSSLLILFFIPIPPPTPPLFPYTTLFRSLNVDYLHQHMTDLPVTVMANQPNPVTNQRPLTSRYGNINLWGSFGDRKSTRLNSSHGYISYAVFCLKKKKKKQRTKEYRTHTN